MAVPGAGSAGPARGLPPHRRRVAHDPVRLPTRSDAGALHAGAGRRTISGGESQSDRHRRARLQGAGRRIPEGAQGRRVEGAQAHREQRPGQHAEPRGRTRSDDQEAPPRRQGRRHLRRRLPGGARTRGAQGFPRPLRGQSQGAPARSRRQDEDSGEHDLPDRQAARDFPAQLLQKLPELPPELEYRHRRPPHRAARRDRQRHRRRRPQHHPDGSRAEATPCRRVPSVHRAGRRCCWPCSSARCRSSPRRRRWRPAPRRPRPPPRRRGRRRHARAARREVAPLRRDRRHRHRRQAAVRGRRAARPSRDRCSRSSSC